MTSNIISLDDLRALIAKGQSKDPLVFLECVMNGQDPRELSDVYKLACEIDEFSNEDGISKDDWLELFDLICKSYRFQKVSLNESVAASKTLAEYLYAKRKQIDIGGSDGSSLSSSTPLTEEEIYLFREKFNDDY